jgi:hypothetical protein
MIEIEPAKVNQIRDMGDGDWLHIEDDVQNVANTLHDIDERLILKCNPIQGVYVIFARERINGHIKEYIVTTATSLDQRLIKRIEKITDPDYNFVEDMEKYQEEADKETEYAFDQKMGENAERLAHAIRKELGLTNDRAFIS